MDAAVKASNCAVAHIGREKSGALLKGVARSRFCPEGVALIVPTLCVVKQPRTLCVCCLIDAERQALHYHPERGNDQTGQNQKP